jgi:hypothetical protein
MSDLKAERPLFYQSLQSLSHHLQTFWVVNFQDLSLNSSLEYLELEVIAQSLP